jgi:hypothetical protein
MSLQSNYADDKVASVARFGWQQQQQQQQQQRHSQLRLQHGSQ